MKIRQDPTGVHEFDIIVAQPFPCIGIVIVPIDANKFGMTTVFGTTKTEDFSLMLQHVASEAFFDWLIQCLPHISDHVIHNQPSSFIKAKHFVSNS